MTYFYAEILGKRTPLIRPGMDSYDDEACAEINSWQRHAHLVWIVANVVRVSVA